MPKLLFLSYFFPPVQTIACVRTWNIAKYLARLGWEVTVVTPDPHLWRIKDKREIEKTNIEIKREGIKCLLTGHKWRCLSPGFLNYRNKGFKWVLGGICRRLAQKIGMEREIGWVGAAKRTCSHLRKEQVDIILASGSPFCSFRVAKWLSEKLNRPYVLDYRDLWTGNLHDIYPNLKKTIKEERLLLADSAAVTIVSPSWAKELSNRYGLAEKVHVVSNGFDPEELKGNLPARFEHFSIVYTGNFYPPKRVITPLMEALRHLKKIRGHESKWGLHYYGEWEQHVRGEAKRFEVSEYVMCHGKVSRGAALSAVRGANLSVVITALVEQPTLADKGMVTGKVFESLGLGTPTLIICPQGSDAALLDDSKGVRAFKSNAVDDIAAFISECIEQGGGKIEGKEQYSWSTLSKLLNDILLENISIGG